jgi:hypothetical protein
MKLMPRLPSLLENDKGLKPHIAEALDKLAETF